MTPLLQAVSLHAGYVRGVDIVAGVDIVVDQGELVTVVGPNGAGKSTLVKAIIGLAPFRRGSVLLEGSNILPCRPHEIVGKGVGYVPQRANVFASMTVSENLDLGLAANPRADAAAQQEIVLDLFPRLAERRRQSAGTLSGGERQMLALGRALMADPKLLLLDEPSAGLSPVFVDGVFERIAAVNASGVAVLLVEQNARRALAMSHRGYVLDLGQNRFEADGNALLDDPLVADLYLGGHRLGRRKEPSL